MEVVGVLPGADPEIEEGGGGHTYEMGWCGARRTQLSVRALAPFPGLRASVACSTSLKRQPENEATYIEHAQPGL